MSKKTFLSGVSLLTTLCSFSCIVATREIEAGSASWNLNANGSWNASGNWSPPLTFPNGATDVATFGSVITANRTITLGQNITIGTAIFNDNNNYLISAGAGQTLSFDANGVAFITVNNSSGNGAHTISAPVNLVNPITLTQNSTSSSGFTLSGPITGAQSITYEGPNLINFSAANTYSGITYINGGSVSYTVSGAFPGGNEVRVGDGIGPANSATVVINASMASSAAFLATLNSDGTLFQGLNRIVRLSGLQGTGVVSLNTLAGNVFEVLGTAGDTTFSGRLAGGIASISFDPNVGSRFLKSGPSKLTLTGNNSTSFVSRTFIGAGSVIKAQANLSLGSNGANSGVFVISGGALELQGNLNLDKRILLNGSGILNGGALRNVSGNNTIPNSVQIGWAGGSVVASNALIGVDADSLTLSGVVTGSQNMMKVGPGHLILSGNSSNTLIGSVIVNEGTLSLNKSGATAIAGPLIINTAGTVTLFQSQQVSNSSIVTVSGGSFLLNGFTQDLDSLNLSQGSVATGGGVLNLTSAITPLSIGSGILTGSVHLVSGAGGTIAFNAAFGSGGVIDGDLDLGGLTRTFDIQSSADIDDLRITGVISNGGVHKTGAGRLVFAGSNTYTGNTVVSLGELFIEGSIGNTPIHIDSTGLLGGLGVIGSGVGGIITNQGTVSPSGGGPGRGKLTLNGTYNQSSQGSLVLYVQSPQDHDQLVVKGGSVSLNGNLSINFTSDATLPPGSEIVLVDNTQGTGISGTFSATQLIDLPSNMTPMIKYTPYTVVLSIPDISSEMTFFKSPLHVIFSLTQQHALWIENRLGFLRHKSLLHRSAQTQTRESVSKQKHQRVVSTSPFVFAAASSLLEAGYSHRSLATEERAEAVGETSKYHLYITPLGSIGSFDTTDHKVGYDYWSGGILVGMDALYDRLSWGIFGGYERAGACVKKEWGHFYLTAPTLNAYASFMPFKGFDLFWDVALGGSFDRYHFERNSAEGLMRAKPRGFSTTAFTLLGYCFYQGPWVFSPELGFQYIHGSIDSYKEHRKTPSSVSFNTQKKGAVLSWLGTSIKGSWGTKIRFSPELIALWQYNFGSDKTAVTFNPLSYQQPHTFHTTVIDKNSLIVGASCHFEGRSCWGVQLLYNFQYSFHALSNMGAISLEARF